MLKMLLRRCSFWHTEGWVGGGVGGVGGWGGDSGIPLLGGPGKLTRKSTQRGS